jgi:hypothetical protein
MDYDYILQVLDIFGVLLFLSFIYWIVNWFYDIIIDIINES